MPLRYVNLDDRTRALMLEEVERDVTDGTLYRSVRLNLRGRECYSSLLREAIERHDDRWLAERLDREGCLKQRETRRARSGGIIDVAVPVTASTTIADGEFNAFYVRAVCRRALDDGIQKVQVYRGRVVSDPRPESEMKVGAYVSAELLLSDLRASKGVDSALGIPAGPNSSLTVRLPLRSAV
jgi:hypothetical protein